MRLSDPLRWALLALALVAFGAPPVEAAPFVYAGAPAAQVDDGWLTLVRAHPGGPRGPVHRPGGVHHRPPVHRPPVHRPGGVHRPPVHRPPVHRPPGYRPPVHRPPVHRPPVVVVPPRGVWVGRPGWYRWSPGGALAAGAALGFVTAAAAAAWAGPPPQQGLCWFYTDPSRRQGFWDACP